MPSSRSQSAVESGTWVAAPGSLIASGRTVTWAVDVPGAEDGRAGEPVLTVAVLTVAVLTGAEAAAAAAAITAVTQAARLILAPYLREPQSRTSGYYPTFTGYQPSGLPGCGWKS
jgi:hypothetical protein